MSLKLTPLCILLFVVQSSFFSLSAKAEVIRLSEPVVADDMTETFGSQFNHTLPNKSLDELLTRGEKALGQPFKMQTHIVKVCQKKGCFFIAQQKQHVIRIAFKDYGFFIPTDSSGKTVMLSGEMVKRTLSKEQADHFSSDLNQEQTLKAGDTYEIVADSIIIPRSGA
ncbi:MAG: DUF4920 domain-containing protein [Pseudomonadota bacterium]